MRFIRDKTFRERCAIVNTISRELSIVPGGRFIDEEKKLAQRRKGAAAFPKHFFAPCAFARKIVFTLLAISAVLVILQINLKAYALNANLPDLRVLQPETIE